MSNPFQQVLDEAASVDHSINDDDYYIVHPGKKHIVSKVYRKVPYGQDANVILKHYIDSADKKHGAGHKAMKGMHLKREAGYTRLSETTEYADVISRSVLGSYSTNVDEAKQKKVVEGSSVDEKTLTPAELKKREEVADALERDKPGMDKSKKMAIATAVAKRVAESEQIVELSKSTLASYAKKAADSATQSGYQAGIETERYASAHVSKRPDSYGKARKKAINRLKGINKAIARLTKEDVEQAAESMVTRTVGGRKFVSAEAAIRLAREIAAKRKEGEKATHKDLIAAKKKLVGEETITGSLDEAVSRWVVSMDIGPHQSIEVTVVATSEDAAKKKALAKAKKMGYAHPMVNYAEKK